MSRDLPATSVAVAVPISSAVGAEPGFGARWDAWVARSNARERLVRRRLRVAAPLLAAALAAALFLMLR